MQYLLILNCIRWITGQRQAGSFPDKGCSVESFGPTGTGKGVLFVYEPRVGKAVLESADFEQYNWYKMTFELNRER